MAAPGERDEVGDLDTDPPDPLPPSSSVDGSVDGSALCAPGDFVAVLDAVLDELGFLDEVTETVRVDVGVRVAEEPSDGVRELVRDIVSETLLDDDPEGLKLTPGLLVPDSDGDAVDDRLGLAPLLELRDFDGVFDDDLLIVGVTDGVLVGDTLEGLGVIDGVRDGDREIDSVLDGDFVGVTESDGFLLGLSDRLEVSDLDRERVGDREDDFVASNRPRFTGFVPASSSMRTCSVL